MFLFQAVHVVSGSGWVWPYLHKTHLQKHLFSKLRMGLENAQSTKPLKCFLRPPSCSELGRLMEFIFFLTILPFLNSVSDLCPCTSHSETYWLRKISISFQDRAGFCIFTGSVLLGVHCVMATSREITAWKRDGWYFTHRILQYWFNKSPQLCCG